MQFSTCLRLQHGSSYRDNSILNMVNQLEVPMVENSDEDEGVLQNYFLDLHRSCVFYIRTKVGIRNGKKGNARTAKSAFDQFSRPILIRLENLYQLCRVGCLTSVNSNSSPSSTPGMLVFPCATT